VVAEAKFVQHPDANGGLSAPVVPFSEGLAAVKTGDGWGFIGPTGRMVIDPQFDAVTGFQDGLAFVIALGKEAYITKTGTFVIDPFPGTTVRAEKARRAALGEGFEFLDKWDGYATYYLDGIKTQDKPSYYVSITRENDKYKILLTGDQNITISGSYKGGKIVAEGRQQDFYKFEIPTLQALPDGSLTFASGDINLKLKRSQQKQ
jgi:hypothetical protein